MKIIYCVCADIGAGLSLRFFHCLSMGTIRSTIYKVWLTVFRTCGNYWQSGCISACPENDYTLIDQMLKHVIKRVDSGEVAKFYHFVK